MDNDSADVPVSITSVITFICGADGETTFVKETLTSAVFFSCYSS